MSALQLSAISHIMLGVGDLAKSLEFYTQSLGLRIMFQTGEMAFLAGGNVTLGLSQPLAAASDHRVGATEIVFAVDGVEDVHHQLSQRGVKFLREPRQVTDQEWAATFSDPDGHRLSIFGPRQTALNQRRSC